MDSSLLRRNQPVLNQALHLGVVPGDPRDVVAAYEIQAAVADMAVAKLAIQDRYGGAGCAHPVELRMLAHIFLNRGVRVLKSRLERLERIAVWMAQIFVAHRLNGDSAGQLTTLVPTHPIRHLGEPSFPLKIQVVLRLGVTIVVLVLGAVAPDVSDIPKFNSRADKHSRFFSSSVPPFFSSNR